MVFPKSLVMFAGMMVLPTSVETPNPPCVDIQYASDPRFQALVRFFENAKSPAQHLSAEFLRAADNHDLDWRLLPSISLVESGGGREAKNNNMFGWNNGSTPFPTLDAGIHIVASRLANSKLYRDKGLDEVLQTYNKNANYPALVKSVMRRIAPSDKL